MATAATHIETFFIRTFVGNLRACAWRDLYDTFEHERIRTICRVRPRRPQRRAEMAVVAIFLRRRRFAPFYGDNEAAGILSHAFGARNFHRQRGRDTARIRGRQRHLRPYRTRRRRRHKNSRSDRRTPETFSRYALFGDRYFTGSL